MPKTAETESSVPSTSLILTSKAGIDPIKIATIPIPTQITKVDC